MTTKTPHLLIAALAVTASSSLAQSSSPNRFSVSARFGFNIDAEFKDIGGFPAQTNPGLGTGGVDHFYDDGFNRVDSRAVADGLTWFWGYSNAGQVPGDGTIVMNSSSSPANRSLSAEEDPQAGFEIRYGRELGQWSRAKWGFESALGYTQLDFSQNRTLGGTLVRVSDAYALGGTIPPPPPYSGTAAGPGPLISDTPARTVTTVPGGAIVTGKRDLEASLVGFKLGPYLEIPLGKHFSVSLNAGLAAAYVDSKYDFSESVTVPSMGPVLQPGVANTQRRAGSGSETDVMFGAYGGAQFNVLLTERWSLFAGAEYQNVGTFSQTVAGKRAEIDLGQSIFVTGGVTFRF